MKNNKKWGMLALIMMFWFTISFITNILGPLIPDIIHNFERRIWQWRDYSRPPSSWLMPHVDTGRHIDR